MATTRYTTFDGEIVSENRGGVMHDYVPDPLGSTVALLDSTQVQTDTFSYWPYGENRTRTGTTATPMQFVGTAGYFTDSASKTYVRARTMDSQTGRWLTQDPIGFRGGDVNLYRYLANRATSATDPSGTVPGDRYGDNLCRRIHHSNKWHSCSEPQWKSCLQFCGGRSNVKYCCSDASDPFHGPLQGPHRNCQCIKSNQCPMYPGDIDTHVNWPHPSPVPPPAPQPTYCRYTCTLTSEMMGNCNYTCTLKNDPKNSPGCASPINRTTGTAPMPGAGPFGGCPDPVDILFQGGTYTPVAPF